MKTSELTGTALDWAVAKCEFDGSDDWDGTLDGVDNVSDMGGNKFSPSTDWSQGGPIIEWEFIECTVMPCGHSSITFDTWLATIAVVDADMVECSGPTPLIAAMRCYVASELGDEVEIPSEVTA